MLTAVVAFIAIASPALSVLADCAGHSTTVQTTTTPQTVVQGETPMTTIPPATPKTGG
jgi:hypothetical protein